MELAVRIPGQRLDLLLRANLPGHSRSFLQKLIADQRVVVNGQPSKASYRVRAGDRIVVTIPPPVPPVAQPEDIPLQVLYEDDDVVVLNKPAGLVVHPAAGNQTGTLVNALVHRYRGQLAGIGGVERPGIVHRLDKGTSGCLVVARTDAAHQSLVNQFRARTVRKVYRAVCGGKFARPTGRIETTIGRSMHDRKKMAAGAPRGRTAVTDYQVLRQFAEYALVELTIHTGRTHQIRVHMAHVGHPVVGDPVYGKSASASRALSISVARPLLHAYKLGFQHPRTGEWVEFTAPVPAEMEQLCPI